MYRAVLDPGVLVAALISREGAPARLFLAWIEGQFDLIVSSRLLNELERVLLRPKFRRYIAEDEALGYVDLFRRMAAVTPDPEEIPRLAPDPGDDYLAALALAARADLLVSGDAHLLGVASSTLRVLSPRAFLDLLSRRRAP